MIHLKKLWRKGRFLLFFLLCFAALDTALSQICPGLFDDGWFYLNDYEVTRRDHPEEVWDRVIFGNSTVIAAYREDVGDSHYVNLGVDYGVVRDLWEMLRQGEITVGSDLVLGLNYLTLYDNFDTNPTYPWHRGPLEPYCYFQRDRLYTVVRETVKTAIGRGGGAPEYVGQGKIVYHGSLSDAALMENAQVYRENYSDLPLSDFSENLAALEQVAAYCAEEGIRLRVVWMPWNPNVEAPALAQEVRRQAEEVLAPYGVEALDLSNTFDESCFYDVGHLNYEYGAYRFMEVMDPWLLS